jgi:hypothetical protein
MKASQIVALSATLILQAQDCARVRIDRYVHDGYGTIQDMQIYDNDNAAKVLPFPINFDARDDENLLQVDGYSVTLKYRMASTILTVGGLVIPRVVSPAPPPFLKIHENLY